MVRIVETTGLLTRLAEYNQNHDAAGKFSSGMTVRALAMGVQAKAADAAAAGAGPGSLEDRAKAVYGVTNDIREAGYVTPDGSMLDFSGRHQSVGYHRQGDRFVPNDGKPDYLAGQRSVDHREVDALYPDSKGSGDDLLNMTVQSGFARVHGMGPDLAVEVGPNLTDRQFTTLARNSRDFTSVTVARTKPNGQPDMNAVYSNFAKVGVPNVSVLRNIATISEALYEATLVEFNQNHDAAGKFSSGGSMGAFSPELAASFTPVEKQALTDWVENDGGALADYLRHKMGPGDVSINVDGRHLTKADLAAQAKAMDGAVARGTFERDGTLYRGVVGDHLPVKPEHMVGRTIHDRSFTSTTTDESYANTFADYGNGVLIHVVVHKGQHGIALNGIYGKHKAGDHDFSKEQEVLLPRNSAFKVTGYQKVYGHDVLTVEMQ